MLQCSTETGMLAPWGLSIAIVVPIGIAYLRLQVQRSGVPDTEMTASLGSSVSTVESLARLTWGCRA